MYPISSGAQSAIIQNMRGILGRLSIVSYSNVIGNEY